MVRIVLLINLLFVYTHIGFGAPIKLIEYDLENGLHVILHRDTTTPIVAINVMYHVGSKNENPDRTGFAHFFEHLMFEGSDNIGRGEYFTYVQNAGGDFNAYTSFDYTCYYEVLPSNQLPLGLWLESERMLHLKIDSVGVETQRKVIKEERKNNYENQPYGSWQEKIFSHTFKTHPYRWIPIGEVQYIDQATIDEFIEFYKTFYVPNNAVLVVCGDIEIEQTKKLIHDYFASIPKGKKEVIHEKHFEQAEKEVFIDTIYDNITVPGLFIAYHAPGYLSNNYLTSCFYEALLTSGYSSPIKNNLIDTDISIKASYFYYPLTDTGLFVFYGFPNDGEDYISMEKAFYDMLDTLANDTIDQQEFNKIINFYEYDHFTRYNSLEYLADDIATNYTVFGNTDFINNFYDEIKKLTKQGIEDFIKQYPDNANKVVLYYLPKEKLNSNEN